MSYSKVKDRPAMLHVEVVPFLYGEFPSALSVADSMLRLISITLFLWINNSHQNVMLYSIQFNSK